MKKSFLLLFLMALLPLAGWATNYEVQVTTYNGSATWTGAKPVVQPGWFTAAIAGGGTPSAGVKSAIASKLQVKDITNCVWGAGTYDYQLELISTIDNTVVDDYDTYTIYVNSSTSATLTITQYTTAPTIDITSLAYVTSTLTYDPTSEGQALLSGGATATTYNSIPVPVIYALSAAPATEADIFTAYGDVKAINAGNYTVYYKVAETANYAGTEWTAIAGDAKNIAKADNTISDLTLAGWTYDPAKTAEPLATGDNPAITFTATNDAANATFSYKKGTGEYGSWAEKVGGHAGSYTLKATIAESDNYKAGEAEVAFTIAKATAVLNVEGVINTDWTVYDGSTHQLFKQAATATVGESQTPVTVKYTYKYCPPGGSYDASWATARTSITSSYLKKTDAGRYRLNISVEGTDDYNGTSNKVGDAFPVLTVAQADITGFTDPVGKTGLRVKGNNEAQDLVTQASWGENDPLGTFQYKVGEGAWSADVPQGTTAGTYSVNFQIVPTDEVNYKTYTIAEPLSVTIAAKDKVTIATNANQTFGYGTTPVIANTVTWSPAEHPNVDFSTAETKQLKWKWYDNAECSGDPVALPASGYYPVGSYYVKGYNAELTGDDADYWEIAYTPALVKITAGQVNATISGTATYGSLPTFTLTHTSGLSPAEAANFNADNNLSTVTVKKGTEVLAENVAPNNDALKALAVGEYDLEATAAIGGGQYAVFVTAGKLTVSAKSIADATITVTTDPDDIVYNNKAWGTAAGNEIAFTVTETSGIEAADYEVAYSNNVNAGTATITLTGKRNYTGTVTKDFTIKKAALTIKANNTTWKYGTTEPTYAVTVEGQAEGETALEVGGTLAGIDGALTVVRTSNETVGTHADALVAKFGSAQPAASDNYTITYSAGNLQIVEAALTIKLIDDVIEGTYGNAPSAAITAAILTDKDNYELDNSVENNVLPDGNLADILDVSGVSFSMVNPIENNKYEVNDAGYEFTMTGATSTNYAVTISNGTYKVNPAAITLYAKDQAINWADEDNTNDEANTTVSDATVAIAAGDLKCGDALTDVVKEIVIASQNVGNNNISLIAADNANYTITVNSNGTDAKYGNLSVTGAPALTLSTADADLADKLASYNGQAMPVTIDFTARNARELPAGTARTWTANTWVTLMLPFDISVRDLSYALGYAIVNVVDPSKTEVKGNQTIIAGKLTMKGGNGSTDVLKANKPFMVKTAEDITGVIDFGNQTIVAPESDADLTVNADENGYVKLIGTYTKKTVSGEDNAKFWFMMGGNYNSWAYIGAGKNASWDVLPFEGYIDMSGVPADARNMTFIFEELDGTKTAIKSISTDDLNKKNAEGWYNLNGMKMDGAPLQKGIYIKDGKKVVIK